ncbi:protein of unknown function [Nitrosospira multiformis]|uniref:DUF4411 family protein n=1 Tax=Nitrosospira multiformis TaxID=1231 RepID=A0A1I7IYI3_9PROT|nr:protein of unknown function [Nitrosospira multiformis]
MPEFWEWLIFHGKNGNIKIPVEVYEEFKDSKNKEGEKDSLASWADEPKTKQALILSEKSELTYVSKVLYEGYTSSPTDDDIEKVGMDPFLIAHALRDPVKRCVVTAETSKSSRKGANRHIPDVCQFFGVRSCNLFLMLSELNFSTRWNHGAS